MHAEVQPISCVRPQAKVTSPMTSRVSFHVPLDVGPPEAFLLRAAEPLSVRALTTSDIPAFRALRLDALRLHPEAFVPTYEEERSIDPATIAPRFRDEWVRGDNFILGAFIGAWLVGAVGVRCGTRVKQRHKATVWLLYADPAVRGSGIGRRLLEDAIERCREHPDITILHLCVSAESRSARALYRRMGFRTYGIEPMAIRLENRYIDIELMSLHLAAEDRLLAPDVRAPSPAD